MANRKEKLTFVISALDKASAPFRRMGKAADRMAAPFRKMSMQFKAMGKNLGFDRIGKAAGRVRGAMTNMAGAVTKLIAPLGGLAYALVSTANGMGQIEAQAASVGLSTEALLGYTNAVQSLGFDADKVVDLVEEMNNKIGESKGLGATTPVKESLHMLKLDLREIAKLKPEEQFERIMEAAAKMKDQQKAVSAVDILMGGDANKIMGSLRAQAKAQGVTVNEVLANYRKMNLTTEQGRAGLQQFYKGWQRFGQVTKSAFSELLGLLGEKLAPMLDKMGTWLIENFDQIRSAFVDKLPKAIKMLGQVFDGLSRAVKPIGDFFSWMVDQFGVENTAMATFAAIIAAVVIPAIAGLATAFIGLGAAIMATPVGWIAGAIMGLVAIGTVLYSKWETVKELWKEYSGLLYATPLAPIKILVDVVASLVENWDAVTETVRKNWQITKNFGNALGDLFSGIFDSISEKWDVLVDTFKKGLHIFSSIGSGIKGVFSSVFGGGEEQQTGGDRGSVMNLDRSRDIQTRARAAKASSFTSSEHTNNARVDVRISGPEGTTMSTSGDADISGSLNSGPLLAGM